MKKGWETFPLSGVCQTFQYGTSSKSSEEGTHPVLRMGNIQDGAISWDKLKYTSSEDDISKYCLKLNDILFNRTNSPELVGKSAIYESGEPALHAGYLIRVQTIHDRLSAHFLNYYLNSPKTRAHGFSVMSSSVNQANINASKLKAYLIDLPPLSEQEEIVEVLDKAFAAIDQAKANIEQNINNAKELFQSKLNQIFSQKGEGWVERPLITVTSFIDYRGRTPKKTEEGIRLLTAKNVRMGYLKREPEEFIAEAAFDDWMTRGIPRKGDVLFTTEAPLANVTLLNTDEKIALAQRIITICPDRDILSGEYLSYCLQSKISQDRILEKGTGATVTGIKSKLLKEIPIPIAPVSQQKFIVQHLDALSSQTQALESHYQTKLDSLDELKKSILQKAFAGDLT